MEKTVFNGVDVVAQQAENFCFAGPDGKKMPIREATDEQLLVISQQAQGELAGLNEAFQRMQIFTQVLAVTQYEMERRSRTIAIAGSIPPQ